jgi:hypothetical protein
MSNPSSGRSAKSIFVHESEIPFPLTVPISAKLSDSEDGAPFEAFVGRAG